MGRFESVISVALLVGTVCLMSDAHSLTINVNYTDIAIKVATTYKEKCYSNVDKSPAYPVMGPPQGECGTDCEYPDKLCFWYEETVDNVLQPKHKCYELSAECKTALEGASAGATPAPGEETTTQGGADSTTAAGGDTTTAEGGATGETTTAAAGTEARDFHSFCCFWANNGECDKNPFFMRPTCQKSCGTHRCTIENAQSCPVTVNTAGCKYTKIGNGTSGSGSTSTGNGSSGGGTSGSGSTSGSGGGAANNNAAGGGAPTWANADQNANCKTWATAGECTKNPNYMKNICKASCGGQ